MIFDTHTHIYLPEFDEDCGAVVQRAKNAGVAMMMLPNVDIETIIPLKKVLADNIIEALKTDGLYEYVNNEGIKIVYNFTDSDINILEAKFSCKIK